MRYFGSWSEKARQIYSQRGIDDRFEKISDVQASRRRDTQSFFFHQRFGDTPIVLSICIIYVTRYLEICHVDKEHAPLYETDTAILDSMHSLLSYKIQVYHNMHLLMPYVSRLKK